MEIKINLSQRTNENSINYGKIEEGITLVALIITIVIMVIIAGVSIAIVYKTKIVEYAISGTQEYSKEGINENKVLEETESLIESAINNLKKIDGNGLGPISPPKTKEELSKEEMIGKYVDYRSSGNDYPVQGQYSGTGTDQIFVANNSMKWRIWGVEENKLLLISETVGGNITLQGAEGYNNAVKILNDACSTAFGSSNYGSAVKVRSINQNDIDKVTNMTEEKRKEVNSNYGNSYTPTNYQWPNIYEQELGKTGEGNLDRSVQENWVTGTTNSTFTGKWTYYIYNITNYVAKIMYNALLTNMSESSVTGTDSHTAYWVASRCVWYDDINAYFSAVYVGGGYVNTNTIYSSSDSAHIPNYAVRPMVEIDLDAVKVGNTGDGTVASPYSVALK